MIDQNFAFLGAIIFALGSVGYLVDTVKGKVKPNRVTWFIWALAPLIAFSAQLEAGVGIHQSLLTFMAGFIPLVILLASFVNKKSYWKISKLDISCGVLSGIGLILWQVTGTGFVAIIFALLADFLAAIPTILKSYRHPETENWMFYLCNAVSALITLLTITSWTFEAYSFPLYLFVITVVLTLIIRFRAGMER